jgi:hypothetical protein
MRAMRTLTCTIGEFAALPESTLLSDAATLEDKERAARALAMQLSIKPQNPVARANLMRLAKQAGKRQLEEVASWVRREVLVPMILRAAEDRHLPQPIRIGTKWIGGSRRPVVPMDQSWPIARSWLRKQAQRYAEEFFAPKWRRERLAVELKPQHAAVSESTGACADLTPDERTLLDLAKRHDLRVLVRSVQSKLKNH